MTKYCRRVFDGDTISSLHTIADRTCVDAEAQLIETDGENDHIHLLVEYPPKVAVSNLVNSLKGDVEPTAAQGAVRHPEAILKGRTVGAVLHFERVQKRGFNEWAMAFAGIEKTCNLI